MIEILDRRGGEVRKHFYLYMCLSSLFTCICLSTYIINHCCVLAVPLHGALDKGRATGCTSVVSSLGFFCSLSLVESCCSPLYVALLGSATRATAAVTSAIFFCSPHGQSFFVSTVLFMAR